jgi:hypothetical protein
MNVMAACDATVIYSGHVVDGPEFVKAGDAKHEGAR